MFLPPCRASSLGILLSLAAITSTFLLQRISQIWRVFVPGIYRQVQCLLCYFSILVNPLYQTLERQKVGLRISKGCHKSGTCIPTHGTVVAASIKSVWPSYLGSDVANNGKAQLLTIEVLIKIMKQPRFLQWKPFI